MLAFLIAFLCCSTVTPCDSDPGNEPAERCALPAQRASSSITVDGRLDESDWEKATKASGFRQLRPEEGAQPSQPTEVRVLYGENAIYIGAVMYDDQPDRIRARLARRDERNQADWFEVSLDSYHDRKTARTFAVNAAGVQRDGLVQGNGGGGGGPLDTSWDAVWHSDVQITDEGWMAELQIPYSMLRFSQARRQTWGIQFRRRIPRNSEVSEWALVPESRRRSGLVAEYGTLTNLEDLNPSRNIQVAPYTMGRLRTEEDPNAPGTMQANSFYDVGADLELGLGSNATLNATINPDFGQVESDPAVLNLSAFETFFDEKRPFFVEGTDVFDFSLGRRADLLYTRRIGASEPVIGAMKLTGRSSNGLVYGAMSATTGDAFTPTRNYGVGRLRQDIGTYSTAGAMLTAFDGPDPLGRHRSFAGGVDWDLRFDGNTYQAQGYVSSTHQRPPASDEDPTTGLAFYSEVGRAQGDLTYDVEFRLRDDAFDPNDVGRMRENNFFRVNGGFRYQINGGQPFGPFQRGSTFLFLSQSWSYKNRLSRGLGNFSRTSVLTENFNRISFQLDSDNLFGGYDLFETRGLWPRARPRKVNTELSVGSDSRRSWELEAQVGTEQRSDEGSTWSTQLEAEWNVSTRLKLSSEISYETEQDVVEWASNETFDRRPNDQWAISDIDSEDQFRDLSDGASRRLDAIFQTGTPDASAPPYEVPIYGARNTDRVDVTVRSNLTLTRNLSIEFFGQLFAARGQYSDFRILSSPDELDAFADYPKRHDFATSSFLSNTVLRWEFRPGSELFLVWSQDRLLDENDPFYYDQRPSSPYDRSPSSRLTDAFDSFPQNAFIIKLRYLFY